jgi:hydrogenase nickel incorporation protein HypA/HybF
MHEASLAQSVVTTVLKLIEDGQVCGEVKEVHMTIGVCQGVVPESLTMFFDMAKEGTSLEHAELHVVSQGIVAHCDQCYTDYNLEIPNMFCPVCGKTMSLTKGNEILITAIEVEE